MYTTKTNDLIKPSVPVSVGLKFKNKLIGENYRDCTVLETHENGFRYEYKNRAPNDPSSSSLWLSYTLWNKRSFKRNNIHYIN